MARCALYRMLAAQFGRPVRLVNDLNAICAGEAAVGGGQGSHHVMCVFVGTGVGMGAVSHGRVVEGADGLATELGHIKVQSPETGRLCGCGGRGCLEAYTSGRHLPALLQQKIDAGCAPHRARPLQTPPRKSPPMCSKRRHLHRMSQSRRCSTTWSATGVGRWVRRDSLQSRLPIFEAAY
ncbi:MAG: ROK family protein [Myxococcota bacterium]